MEVTCECKCNHQFNGLCQAESISISDDAVCNEFDEASTYRKRIFDIREGDLVIVNGKITVASSDGYKTKRNPEWLFDTGTEADYERHFESDFDAGMVECLLGNP